MYEAIKMFASQPMVYSKKKYVTLGVIQVRVKSFVKNPKHKLYATMY